MVNETLDIALCVYSATGNTRNLARACGDGFRAHGHRVLEIDVVDTLRRGALPRLDGFDLVGLATPVMMFRPPWAARRFLDVLSPASEVKPAFLLVSSAGLPANSAHTLALAMGRLHLDSRWLLETTCADSYIPFRKWFGTRWHRDQPDQQATEGARRFGARILAEWKTDLRDPIRFRPLSLFHWACKNAPEDGARHLLGPRNLQEDRCTGCGLCVRLCPTGALGMEGERLWCHETECIGCCACFNRCPEGAWRLKRFGSKYFYRGAGGPGGTGNGER